MCLVYIPQQNGCPEDLLGQGHQAHEDEVPGWSDLGRCAASIAAPGPGLDACQEHKSPSQFETVTMNAVRIVVSILL